jgi:hypothetical protein
MASMQNQIVAGETLNYRAITADYPASAGWVVTLYLNPRAGGTATSVASTADGDDHLLQVDAATTATWASGWWGWETWAAKGAERYRLEAGQLQVVPGLIGAAAGLDTRSQAQKALDDAYVKALDDAYVALAAWTPTTKRYRINGREMEFNSAGEILQIITHWQTEVAREQAALAMAAGRPNPRKLQVRMGRA